MKANAAGDGPPEIVEVNLPGLRSEDLRASGYLDVSIALGQRIFLLHDGRTTDLNAAIDAHASRGSEASTVEGNFDNLSPSQQQDLLNFLRSL